MTISMNCSNISVPFFSRLTSFIKDNPSMTCIALTAFAGLGGMVLYRSLALPEVPKRNVSSVVLIPHEGGAIGNKPTEEERKQLYLSAKKVIESLPKDFLSKVNFDDRRLKIEFFYDMRTLETLAGHQTLWHLFSAEEHFTPFPRNTIFQGVASRFRVHNFMEIFSQLRIEREALEKRARTFFESEASAKPSPCLEALSIKNYSSLLAEIFKQSKGVSIGDLHREIAPKYFLVSQMAELVRQNVDVLFIEGLRESIQGDLDAYFDLGTDVEAVPLSFLNNYGYLEEILQSKQGYTMLDVIKTAKRAGIKRVVGIDYATSFDSEPGENRLRTMNYLAKQVIEREMPKGNYVIFSGLHHAVAGSPVLSLAELLGISSIAVFPGKISYIRQAASFDFSCEGGTETIRPDFLLFISSEESQKK